ncbi:MAG: tRNA anti-like, partial [Chloroflexi bacterium]
VIKEYQVIVTATPIPEPTVVQGKVYEFDDISSEFEINALVANSKYLNQTISISGEINDIDYFYTSDRQLGKILTVSLPDSVGGRLLCGLSGKENYQKMDNLSAGDTVVVNGTIVEWDGAYDNGTGWLYVYPCSIVD